jgi:hypothetical protein
MTILFILAVITTTPCNAHPVYALRPVVTPVRVQHTAGSYTAMANLTFKVVETKPAMITSVDPGLLDHVRGHQIIAQRVARSSIGSVRATGSSAAQARARLKQAVSRLTSDSQKELDREDHVYETVTENGAAQSQGPVYGFPGGPDAHELCGQP